jgi:hypothetical protein
VIDSLARARILVVPVAPEHWASLGDLFAKSQGVDECWCMWPLRSPLTFCPDRSVNRAAFKSLLDSGHSPGLVALNEERAVGWCALGPRKTYPQYEEMQASRSNWAIPCIYIDPTAHRDRVAYSLIETAAERAIANHAAFLDGPPAWWSPGDAAATALATKIFLANGFDRIASGARMPVLRRELVRITR